METQEIKKDSARKMIIAARLTHEELKAYEKLCKEKKVTFSRLISYSLEKTLLIGTDPSFEKETSMLIIV